MDRRVFLSLATGAFAGAGCAGRRETAAKAGAFELEEATLDDLRKGLEQGRWTAQSLVGLYTGRISAIDKAGPKVNSVIELNPDAAQIAAALDQERARGQIRGPLHGIPVLIKDNLNTGDRMQTTAGSLALSGMPAGKDSFVAARLRQAGAVILGKTNLSEWANFRSSHSVSGWSGRGRLTRNPYALDRNACGSSSGSGVAVAANLCAVAIGTETNGSIVCPSSINGIVGIKPTVGLVSRSGIVPISHSQDTAGPMTRTVRDAALLLSAIVAVDPDDAATAKAEKFAGHDYTQHLDAGGLKGARIGVARNYFGPNREVSLLAEEAIAAIRAAGAEPIDIELPHKGEAGKSPFEVLLYEFKDGLNRYLGSRGDTAKVRTLAEVIEFNTRNAAQEMPYFQQETLELAEQKGPLTEKAYRDALATTQRLAGREGIDAAIAKDRLDAIVAPGSGPAWVIDLIHGDHSGGGGSSSPAAQSGYPNICVPMGFVHGLPVGLSFFGPAFSEPTLLKLAYAFEQATHYRKPPRFLPAAPFEA